MSEDLLIRHCAPTLAGIKTGNLFSCVCPCRKELTKSISSLNKKLVPRGIRILPLKVGQDRALIYVYRPHDFKMILRISQARELLLRYGYHRKISNACVNRLVRRLRYAEEFPHEIGLFFVIRRMTSWDSSTTTPATINVGAAGKSMEMRRNQSGTFEQYDRCSKIYVQQWKQRKSIEQLTVAG